jgi:4a-hydroxytetrahydrobiopterin dehydratase
MTVQTIDELREKKCVPCSGAVPASSPEEVDRQLRELTGWQASADHRRIFKSWTVKNFGAAIEFFQEIARAAEAEDHHPDLHLEDYRKVRVEITTHAIGGLTENDFILAAKIDLLPVELKR